MKDFMLVFRNSLKSQDTLCTLSISFEKVGIFISKTKFL